MSSNLSVKNLRSFELQLLDLLREHLIRAQFAERAYGTDLPSTLAAVMNELARDVRMPQSELAELLHVHQSSLSRSLDQLVDRKMLVRKPKQLGSRRVLCSITKKGQRFIDRQMEVSEKLELERAASLTGVEVSQLEKFLAMMTDVSRLNSLPRLPRETTMTVIWWALTYAHGIVEGNYLSSGHSVSHWVLLSEIQYNQRSISDISQLLLTPVSVISLRIKSLLNQKLVAYHRHTTDSRSKVLTLTNKGFKILAEIESAAQRDFSDRYRELSSNQWLQFIDLMQRYVYGKAPKHNQEYTVRKIVDHLEIVGARRAALEVMGKPSMREYPLTGYLFCSDNELIEVAIGVQERVLIELLPRTRTGWRVVNIVATGSTELSLILSEIITVLKRHLGSKVTLDPQFDYLKLQGS